MITIITNNIELIIGIMIQIPNVINVVLAVLAIKYTLNKFIFKK